MYLKQLNGILYNKREHKAILYSIKVNEKWWGVFFIIRIIFIFVLVISYFDKFKIHIPRKTCSKFSPYKKTSRLLRKEFFHYYVFIKIIPTNRIFKIDTESYRPPLIKADPSTAYTKRAPSWRASGIRKLPDDREIRAYTRGDKEKKSFIGVTKAIMFAYEKTAEARHRERPVFVQAVIVHLFNATSSFCRRDDGIL